MSNNLSELLNKCTELKNKMDQFRPLDAKQLAVLDKQIKFEHVWTSNKIEGNSLSLNETETILNGITVDGASLKDTLEVVDLSDAYDYMRDLISNKQPLDKIVIRDLNRLVTYGTANSKADAGNFRAVFVQPSGIKGKNPYADPYDVPVKVDELIEWSRIASEKLHPIQYAAELHYRFVTIHPFVDGNGRTARLLMNFALSENGYPIVNLKGSEEQRNQYISKLMAGNESNDMNPFIEFIADKAKSALVDRIKILELNQKNFDEARNETYIKEYLAKHQFDKDEMDR